LRASIPGLLLDLPQIDGSCRAAHLHLIGPRPPKATITTGAFLQALEHQTREMRAPCRDRASPVDMHRVSRILPKPLPFFIRPRLFCPLFAQSHHALRIARDLGRDWELSASTGHRYKKDATAHAENRVLW
jgi:hypothetical protein